MPKPRKKTPRTSAKSADRQTFPLRLSEEERARLVQAAQRVGMQRGVEEVELGPLFRQCGLYVVDRINAGTMMAADLLPVKVAPPPGLARAAVNA